MPNAATADKKKRAAPPDDIPAPSKRGGARPGAGRKSAVTEAELAPLILAERKAKLKKMAFDAQMSELEFKVKSGEYVARADVREANATAFAMIAQTLRSIPDNLERKLGVSPEIAEAVGTMIDMATAELSEELQRIHEGARA